MSEIHSCGYFCQIPACVLKQRDTLRDKLQTSESADNNQHAGSAILVTFSPDSQTWKIERDHGLALTSQPAPKGVNTLQDAAQAVLHRWDSSKWDWAKQGPTADLMAALRVAVEAQPAPAVAVEPTNGYCANRKAPGGCQLHNLQCGYPQCDQQPIATQPAPTMPEGVKSVLICPRCKVDRFSADCPSRIGCPIDAQAHLTRKATPKDKP